MRRVSISSEIFPTKDLKNKKEGNIGGRNFVSTVRARRFLTSSRPNFQTFCTLAVRKSLLRVVRRGKRTASRRETPRILNPHGSQSLDPEETKGRYILPLRFPFSRHPRRCPPAQRRFLIRSRRFVHSAQRHVRRYSPLIFAIPWQKTAKGGRDVSSFLFLPSITRTPRFISCLFVHLNLYLVRVTLSLTLFPPLLFENTFSKS